MSGTFFRLLLVLVLSTGLFACGGGGGGGAGGGGTSSSSSAAPVDTDKDGHPDAQDVFPNDPNEWKDSDGDGVGDNSDAFPSDANESKDTDGDGLGDNTDVFPSDASETQDTDGDGVGDNADVFPNDSSESKDTDGDGVGDNADALPSDATEWMDVDADGVGDNSDPTPMGNPIAAWPTFQGNAQHSGKVDVALNPSNFVERWTKVQALTSSQQGAAGDGLVFFNNGGVLTALDARTGYTRWTQTLEVNYSFYAVNPPAYTNGTVYIETGGNEDAYLWAFSATNGQLLFKTKIDDQWSTFYAPTIVDGKVYMAGGYYGGIYAIDGLSGVQSWWQPLNQYDAFTPAVAGDYVYAYTGFNDPKLSIIDKATGNLTQEIKDPNFEWGGWSMNLAPVVSGKYVLANYQGRLVAFDTSNNTLAWALKSAFSGQPVVKDQSLFIINSGVLEERKLADGALINSFGESAGLRGNPLLTDNLIFAADETSTYAFDLTSRQIVWTLADKSGAMLMAEGALLIFTSQGIVALDVLGDRDSDGLPDWWEQKYAKNLAPAVDTDDDGLTNLEEYTNNTNPLVADTDADGLSDGEEVSAGKTSPLTVDSDGDGLSDGVEVNTHLTNPSKIDSDGDGLSDGEEIAAQLNPLDSADKDADADNDGFSNYYELRAGTNLFSADDHPHIGDWEMDGANSHRDNYVPLLLDASRFGERWSINSELQLSSSLVGSGQVLVNVNSQQLAAWNLGTGQQSWRSPVNEATTLTAASLYQNQAILLSKGQGDNFATLSKLNVQNGNAVFTQALANDASNSLIANGKSYQISPNDSRQINAVDLVSGNLLWTSSGNSVWLSNSIPLMADATHLVAVSSNQLLVFSATSGVFQKTIQMPTGIYIQSAALTGTGDLVVASSATGVVRINLSSGALVWSQFYCGQGDLALGNQMVYTLKGNKLCALNLETGAVSWNLRLNSSAWNNSNIVLTASHLFFATDSNTYAVNLNSRQVDWSIAKAGDSLAMDADGTLIIRSAYQLTAIDTRGDQDNDAIPDAWEAAYGGDLIADADLESDGLGNLAEYTAGTNPLVGDTDGDGLNDGDELDIQTNPLSADSDSDSLSDADEVNTHHTDPLQLDSDSDGIDDALEISLGLNPLDADDANSDNDDDGFSNLEEAFAGSDLNSSVSKPVASAWAMPQATPAFTGYQAVRLNAANFQLRWNKRLAQSPAQIISSAGRAYYTATLNNKYGQYTLDAVDGSVLWSKEDGSSYFQSGLAYDQEKLIYLSDTNSSNWNSVVLAGNSGQALFSSSFTLAYSYPETPVVANGIAYARAGASITAVNVANGQVLWQQNLKAIYNSTASKNLVADSNYVYYAQGSQIIAREAATGNVAFTMDAQTNLSFYLQLGAHQRILAYKSNQVISFDLTTHKRVWSKELNTNYSWNDVAPALGNGRIYLVNNGQLVCVNELDGSDLWSVSLGSDYDLSNVIATPNYVFISTGSNTYAYSTANGQKAWTYPVGGDLSLSPDGALYVLKGHSLTAISLEGDSDEDGMPDWWERLYGLDPEDGGDAALDGDSDDLTNLEEFQHKTSPLNDDSDADGLTDGAEITLGTNPKNSDTDNDGMGDNWESQKGLNPLSGEDRDLDSDGDSIPNFIEYQEGTDPANALSLPELFGSQSYSFEDGNLPAGWSISDTTTDLSISLANASDGSKSLQARQEASVSFEGFFAASDLAFDVKNGCSSTYSIEVAVDDITIFQGNVTSDWQRMTALIPIGRHKVSLNSNSYSCAVYMDNVTITPAKSNAELGVQFAGYSNYNLSFVGPDNQIIRNYWMSPMDGYSLQGITSMGMDYLVAVYSGVNARVGLLNLTNFSWRYFDLDLPLPYSGNGSRQLVASDHYIYVLTQDSNGYSANITRIDSLTGATAQFGAGNYSVLAVDKNGIIYAHRNGVNDRYDPESLSLINSVNSLSAYSIAFDSHNRMIVATGNEIVRYNDQRLIDARIDNLSYAYNLALNERDQLLVRSTYGAMSLYSSDWLQSTEVTYNFNLFTSFPMVDSDNDSMPDWWETAQGVDPNDDSDAAPDGDSDGLSNLEEYFADTNPAVDDTDSDLLSDGDEVNDYGTSPKLSDSDGDGLSDAEEVLTYSTNPLSADSDGDLVSDYLEINQYATDPNDANSLPPVLSNFTESFEAGATGWLTPTEGADAGWSLVSDSASDGSHSLRSNAIGNNQSAQVEFQGMFAASTVSFDAKVSSEACCDRLQVYVDDQQMLNIQTADAWQSFSFSITAGLHKLRFVYRKDSVYTSGADAAWIDKVQVN